MQKYITHNRPSVWLSLLIIVVCLIPGVSCGQTRLPDRGELTIVAWWGIPKEELTIQRFEELKAAGFNVTFHNMSTVDELKQALCLGRQTGVKIIATNRDVIDADTNIIHQIKDSVALLAYSLSDEPSLGRFADLREKVLRIKSIDTTHPCYINLLPDCGREMLGADFSTYLRRGIEDLALSFLSFDIYPVTKRGINAGWYDNLEKASAAAGMAGIPLWAFVLSTPHSTTGTIYPMPTMSSLRLQVYANLAYGAQAIQYFTYWLPEDGTYNYYAAPISEGKKTPTYTLVQRMNREIHAVSAVFKGAKVKDVAHVGVAPKGTKMLHNLPQGVSFVKRTGGSHLLVSQLQNGENSYVVIQNCSLTKTVSLVLNLAQGMKIVRKDGQVVGVEGKRRFRVLPGDVVILDNTRAQPFRTGSMSASSKAQMVSVGSIWVVFIFINIFISTSLLYINRKRGNC